ncbi:hypothetical protein [Streptomyces sp. NPDC018055]|uniref:hypothetical protein n=1 Tax=Streptomyces sp. NPDC018055 TaxID=3365038 RepID=UPI0037A61696
MRITATTVQTAANYAKEVSNGAFNLAYHANPGDGRRYVDGQSMTLSWKGRNAAVLATAYYLGAARTYMDGKPFPAEIEAIRAEIHGRGTAAASSYNDGKQAARGKIDADAKTLAQLLTADGVTLTSEHIATGTDGDGWEHHEYRVTLAYDGRTYTQTVLHGIGNEDAPELTETTHMFISQSRTALLADSYEDWASDYSSDPAEWMPEKTYADNVAMGKALQALFGEERFERYAMADHDG